MTEWEGPQKVSIENSLVNFARKKSKEMGWFLEGEEGSRQKIVLEGGSNGGMFVSANCGDWPSTGKALHWTLPGD